MNGFFYDSYQLILIFLLPGVFLGIVYDIFRILRISRASELAISGGLYDKIRPRKPLFGSFSRVFKTKSVKIADKIIVFIEDILFWLIAAVTEILFIFHTNGGEIRIYCLLASILGFILYNRTLGRLVTVFAKQIIFLFRCLIYWSLYAIIFPVKLITNGIQKIMRYVYEVTLGRLLISIQNKKRKAYSDRMKTDMLAAAGCGFAVYQKERFGYEGENEYLC